jgi:hypothetical protein
MRGPEIRRQLLEALGQEVPEDIADKKDTTDENKSPKLKPKKNGSAAKSQKN